MKLSDLIDIVQTTGISVLYTNVSKGGIKRTALSRQHGFDH